MSKLDTDKYIPVEDHEDFVKERQVGAVLNSNIESYNKFRRKKLKELEVNKRLDTLEENVSSILSLLDKINNKLE